MNDLPASRPVGGGAVPVARRLPPQRRKKPEDTSVGCRAFAAADLGRAAAQNVDRGRWRFEHSAAAWSARADLLDRLDRLSAARMKAVQA